jgi:hypothetical protein
MALRFAAATLLHKPLPAPAAGAQWKQLIVDWTQWASLRLDIRISFSAAVFAVGRS